jgi:hypothetical protein
MDKAHDSEGITFFGRLGMALRVLFSGEFAQRVGLGLHKLEERQPVLPPERAHASGLVLLAALQREGRLIDFLQQDITSFSDEDVGAAARVVHSGCRKLLHQYLDFEPARREAEGASLTVPPGFDPQRIRLTGNIAGQPPYQGTLKHHGWVATAIRMPAVSEAVDPRVLAPAEVELA